jgi:integrase
VDNFLTPSISLDHRQNLTLIILGFAAFLRFDDLIQLKGTDVSFHEGFCKIFLRKRKNDLVRQGGWVLIASSGKKTCPVTNLRQFHMASLFLLEKKLFPILGQERNYWTC